ncbi:MAG: TraB/GumN family protein [Chitinophagaceae bacterium]
MRCTHCLLLSLTTLLFSCLQAQVLYRCTSPGNDTVTYLLGTHHGLPRQHYYYDSLYTQLLSRCEVVFVETNVLDSGQARRDFLKQAGRIAVFTGGRSLTDYLSDGQIAQLKDFYRLEFGISGERFDRSLKLTPFFLHQRFFGSDTTRVSVDKLINQDAQLLKKEIVSLDEPEQLLATYTWFSQSISPDSLLNLAAGYGAIREQHRLLDTAYLAQDTAGINRFIRTVYSAVFRNELIHRRNRLWEEMLMTRSRKTNFIAAGIAHISFTGGLLEFYRGRNYRVEPVDLRTRQ